MKEFHVLGNLDRLLSVINMLLQYVIVGEPYSDEDISNKIKVWGRTGGGRGEGRGGGGGVGCSVDCTIE